jgi:putative hydrolase of the HAD superfamily
VVRARPTALLVDLDGVLRRWDPAVPARVEAAHGLPAGALEKTAMDWSRLLPVITGQVSHADWMAGVAEALDAPEAVAEWQRYRGEVDPDVLAFVREARAAGVPVAIATNATDQLDADLAALGLTGEVDAVVNSSVVGAHKPTREFFAAAAQVRWCPALSRPRRSSLASPAFGPNTVSASSSRIVGGSSLPIDRYTAALLALTVINGLQHVASTTSRRRDLPHRFSGARMTSRGACAHAGCAWVAAIHRVTASVASGEGSTT